MLAALAERLSKKRSPYAAVLAALTRMADSDPNPKDIDDLAQEREIDVNDAPALDRQWSEDPVVFDAALEQRKLHISLSAASRHASSGGVPT